MDAENIEDTKEFPVEKDTESRKKRLLPKRGLTSSSGSQGELSAERKRKEKDEKDMKKKARFILERPNVFKA